MKKSPKLSSSGYKKNSPDKNEKSLIIPSGDITMNNVEFPVVGIDNLGNEQMMYPGMDYTFPGSSVLEVPMQNNEMKRGGMKKPNNAGFDALPKRVQDLIMKKMQVGGTKLSSDTTSAQAGSAVGTPKKLNTLTTAADPNKPGQKIATQYNLEKLPNITERNTWNNYLSWVEKQGYKPGSDSAMMLNTGKNRFSELSSSYNKEVADKLKQEYAKAKTRDNFDKSITEDQFIKARSVNSDMMINAQKVYGQQTKKDNWFGSETASTYYPKVQGLGVSYTDLSNPDVQTKIKSASGKLTPVQVFDYKTNQQVPFRGVTTITGYDTNGLPQYDLGNIQPYQPNMASDIYYDPAALSKSAKSAYDPYINPQQVTPQKMGGNLNKFVQNYQKQFGGSHGIEDIQGQSMDQFLQDKNEDFVEYLAKNNKKALYEEEINNFMQIGGQTGPFGAYGSDKEVPDYVKNVTDQFNFPNNQEQSVNPYQFTTTQNGADPQEDWFNNELQANQDAFDASQQKNKDNQQRNSNIADFALAGVQGLNKFFNKANADKQEEWIKQQNSISNMVPTIYGNRGNYDVNQGNFRPDQKTPGNFKKGGTYSMNKQVIQDLIAQGYNIEFLD